MRRGGARVVQQEHAHGDAVGLLAREAPQRGGHAQLPQGRLHIHRRAYMHTGVVNCGSIARQQAVGGWRRGAPAAVGASAHRAVPPVDRMVKPFATSPLAKSTRPVLSETERSARRAGMMESVTSANGRAGSGRRGDALPYGKARAERQCADPVWPYCAPRVKAQRISCDPVVRMSLITAFRTICWLAWRTPSSK